MVRCFLSAPPNPLHLHLNGHVYRSCLSCYPVAGLSSRTILCKSFDVNMYGRELVCSCAWRARSHVDNTAQLLCVL